MPFPSAVSGPSHLAVTATYPLTFSPILQSDQEVFYDLNRLLIESKAHVPPEVRH